MYNKEIVNFAKRNIIFIFSYQINYFEFFRGESHFIFRFLNENFFYIFNKKFNIAI